jgi:plastocyanin
VAPVAVAAALLAVLALAPVVHGADYEIRALKNNVAFDPSELTIAPGDTVTFSLEGGGAVPHNVHFDDTGAKCGDQDGEPTSEAWSCPRTYDSVGDFSFVCDEHPGMGGTVHVRTPDPGPGPGEPPPPPPPPPGDTSEPDVLSPGVELGGRRTQRVLDQGAVVVKVETTEAATLTATGRVNVPPPARLYRLRKATRTTTGPARVTLRLRLSPKVRRAVRVGLTYRRRLTASVRVTATDAAGNRTVKSRRIGLRR